MVSLAMMELVDICEESPALCASIRFDSLARALVFRDLCPVLIIPGGGDTLLLFCLHQPP